MNYPKQFCVPLLLTVCTSILLLNPAASGSATESKVTIKGDNESVSNFSMRIFTRYQVLNRPVFDIDPKAATIVYVDLFINSFGPVSIRDMDITVDLILHQRWTDSRLQFSGYDDILVYSGATKSFWTSDLFFRNAKHSKVHDVTQRNQMIWLNANGEILFSQKLSLVLSCNMDFTRFPMDTQKCSIIMGSFGYTEKDIKLKWSTNRLAVVFNNDISLNEFEIPIEFNATDCQTHDDATGNFSCIKADFIIKRKLGFYLLYTYVPTGFIVGISWLSFFVCFTSTPARVSLGLLSVLTLMTQSVAAIGRLPRISYVKAIDIWLFTCLAFVVTSLVEFAFVTSLCDSQWKDRYKYSNSHNNQDDANDHDNKKLRRKKTFKKLSKVMGHKIDYAFQIIFPVSFLLFNLMYWWYYKQH